MLAADTATAIAAEAINNLGIELLAHASTPGQNALLSPYSIQSALAIAYAGADGVTRAEMAAVLHYPSDDAELHRSFAKLREGLEKVVTNSAAQAEYHRNTPVTLTVANRLFGQTGYDFREPFLALVRDNYAATFDPLNFRKDALGATKHINGWVEEQTHQRIRHLIPPDALNELTRLVLVNAICLKASWSAPFDVQATKPGPFRVNGAQGIDVPMMEQRDEFSYAKGNGFCAVYLPYNEYAFRLLLILPDEVDGITSVELAMTPALLGGTLKWETEDVTLVMPKFKLEPPLLQLSGALEALGMKSAFNKPAGSANFDRIAPRRPNDDLAISEVFHQTFLSVDEKGTEAAAATGYRFVTLGGRPIPKPITVRVDHPFLFAIQDQASDACLFLGRVVDPR
jgi:serpin B